MRFENPRSGSGCTRWEPLAPRGGGIKGVDVYLRGKLSEARTAALRQL